MFFLSVMERPVVPEQRHRQPVAVLNRLPISLPIELLRLKALAHDPARVAKRQAIEDHVRAVFVLDALRHPSHLQRPHPPSHRLLHSHAELLKCLNGSLLGELLAPLLHLLSPKRFLRADDGKVLRREPRDALELEAAVLAEGVADAVLAGIEEAYDVSRPRFFDRGALGGEELTRVCQPNLFSKAGMENVHSLDV